MRTGGVPAALFLVLASVLLQVSAAGDIYWEGEEDAADQFLEVKDNDPGFTGHLKRIKRDWLSPFSFFGGIGDSKPEAEADTATDNPGSDDTVPDDKDEVSDNFGSGSPDKPESDNKEKTLRVTFVVMEPYRTPAYTNRDSPEFRSFSGSLGNAIDQLFETLPGTQRASLVRIQSRLNDEFSCKVTVDIVTRDYDDTERIKELLRDHIKNYGRLGLIPVLDQDFSAQLIDPATLSPDDVTDDQNGDSYATEKNDFEQRIDNGDQTGYGNGDNGEGFDNGSDGDPDQTGYDNGANQNGYDNGVDDGFDNQNGFDIETTTANSNTRDNSGYSNRGDQPGFDNGGVLTGYENQPDNNNVDFNNFDQNRESTNAAYPDQPTDTDNAPTRDTYEWSPFSTTPAPPTKTCNFPMSCSSSSVTFCPEQRCDGVTDCPYGEDEQNCSEVGGTPSPTEDQVTTRRPFIETTRLSEDNEVVPPSTSNFECPSEYMRCDETRCVPLSSRCNGRRDCLDGADEAGCPNAFCGADDFRCDSGKCIEPGKKCDHVYDCPGREDERDCECTNDEFRCESDGSCIEYRKRCDNERHCADGSDEFNCDSACSPEQWQCDYGNCIKRSQRCDGHVDCPSDRSDERNCLESYFRCRSGKLIPKYLRCNRHYDCQPTTGDFSDEQNCPCGDSDFKCDNGHCIPAYKRCDRTHDCQDGSDERHCTYGKICMAYECTSGMCVQAESRCNGTAECDDGSDEDNCPCRRGQYQCRDGSCINIAFLCNGRDDCSAGEDEYNCRSTCALNEFTCNAGSQTPCALRCNGNPECDGGEDEADCEECSGVRCSDGTCVPSDLICDSNRDCPDGEDELDCDFCDKDTDFRCDSGTCVSRELYCNGVPECADGSDEIDCNRTMVAGTDDCPDQFQCVSNKICINYVFYCDGHQDCIDGSDEVDCPWYMTRASRSPVDHVCQDSEFTCYDGRCIPHARRCDNIYDCSDFSDEQNCYNAGTGHVWTATTAHLNEECSQDDSFQCRTGGCIPTGYVCDGRRDCRDGSDEEDCWPYNTTPSSDLSPYGSQGQPGDRGSNGSPSQPGSQGPYGGQGQPEDRGRPENQNPYGPQGQPGNQDPYRGQSQPGVPDPYGGESQPGTPSPYDGQGQPGGSDPYRGPSQPGGPDPYGRPSQPGTESPYDGQDPYSSQGQPGDRRQPGNLNPYGAQGQPGNQDPYRGQSQPGGPDPYEGQSQPGTQSPYEGQSQPGGSDPYRGQSQPGGPDPYGGQNQPGTQPPYGGEGQPGGPGPYDGQGQPGSQGSYGGQGQPGSQGSYAGQGQPGSQGPYGGQSQPGGPDPYGGEGQPGGSDPYGGEGQPGGSDPYAGQNQPGSQAPYDGQGQNRDTFTGRGQGQPGDYGQPAGQGPYAGQGQPGDRRPSGGQGQSGNRPGQIYPDYSQTGGCDNRTQWRCENGPCIALYQRCNGHIDCPLDFSDEFDCPRGSPVALELEAYPLNQSVRYAIAGGDVVFQCRDKGPQRAPVRWVRQGGKPIKPGSTDIKGRLEMFKVKPSDAGVYICQATGYLSYPGSEIQVTLVVDMEPVTYRPPYPVCQGNEATCGNGQCIPKTSVCDGNIDCSDRSDEENCHREGLCEPNQFKCNNGKCVLKTWVCDSENDCGDSSDEQDCEYKPQGMGCSGVEFSCQTQRQCVPKSYHCDGQNDCFDGSDEIGCASVFVTVPPTPSTVRLNPGDTLILKCEAVGVPTPLISWRLNWGHVPSQCTSSSEGGVGVLTCVDMQPAYNGAYSCEAIQRQVTSFAVPDAIVIVNKTDLCPQGYFNNEARSPEECIRCFCFGESTQCRSADLYTYNMPTPLGEGGTLLKGVKVTSSGDIEVDSSPIDNQYYYQPLRNGATVTKLAGNAWSWSDSHPYLTLPETYNGIQLTSYGGYIKYTLQPQTQYQGSDTRAPTIIIKGKYVTLLHTSRASGRAMEIEARLTPENWMKSGARGVQPASREDIMMALDDIEMILLRADYNNAGVNITDFAMESAQHINMNMGAASLVEECTCPRGYEGLSCQKCASGYIRKKDSQWLGSCAPEECPPGTFGNPSIGIPCKPCPCPLTNRENQFAGTCSLTPDGSVACDCYEGYEGQRCEVCAPGYEGNPNIPGDSCIRKPSNNCNPTGTRTVRLPDECVCKDNVQGRYCDQCKNNSFFLSEQFRHGCAQCFCSGVSTQCKSSNFRRKSISAQFNVPQIVDQVRLYKSAPSGVSGPVRYTAPVESDQTPRLIAGSLAIDNVERSNTVVYYWSLPDSFTGDKVTSYGAYLQYTLRNVPTSIDPRTRNNAPDVQIISDNQLTLNYVGDFVPAQDGTLNVSVQFTEERWQRPDGKEVPRAHLLLALADVKTILIKGTYAVNYPPASPTSAIIDIAEPNGFGPLALEVEQCTCPPSYIGTSCEDCAPGYTRSSSGLYLQHCEPCECNGKSNMCNPETGVCFDCADNTDGEQCENCKPGYDKDEYGNCVSSGSITTCNCDPRGSTGPCDAAGNCYCKQNVEGESCDRCRPGTFGIDQSNPTGCLSCFCSGVTTDCHEANHYSRIPMAAPILSDSYGGFTITDLAAEKVIKDDFVPQPGESELMYTFQSRPDTELYWSLPIFPGNRVLSYGGSLSLRQKFSSSVYDISERGTDVILEGDSLSLYWTNPNQFRSGESFSYQVPLREEGWFLLGTASSATRSNIMNVLRNLKRVLVRATVVPDLYSTSIADVSMDTAAPISEPGLPSARGIEVCMCPPGYSGTSCESCLPGYYKDNLGYCLPCPCNGYDCQLNNYGQVTCNCQPPYKGPDCSTVGLVMELHPEIHEADLNNTFSRKVTFICKYRAPEPLTIKFYHDGEEQGAPKYFNESRLHKDGWHGEHIWETVWDIRKEGEIYECLTITKKGYTLGILTTSLPESDGESSVVDQTTRFPTTESTVIVTIDRPNIKIQKVGSSVNFTCQAQSINTRSHLPVRWSKSGGELPQGRYQIDENLGLLLITNLQVYDSGKYICETNDGITTKQAIASLTVPGNEMTEPVIELTPLMQEYYEGDRIELNCEPRGNPSPVISWQRGYNRPLPLSSTNYGNLLIIDPANVQHSGEYTCVATNAVGTAERTAVITVRPRPSRPIPDKLSVSNSAPSVDEGQSIRIVCTGTTSVPAGSIDWVRQDNALFLSNVQSRDGVLFIDTAVPENQGVYICQSPQTDVEPIAVLIKVVAMGPPSDLPNINVSVDRLKLPTGGSGSIDCNPIGRPQPRIKWSKHNGSFGPRVNQRSNTLIVSGVQDEDQGYYMCEGSVNGEVVANTFVYLEVEKRERPSVDIWPSGEQAVPLGGEYELACRVMGGFPAPEIMWDRSNGRPLSPQAQIRREQNVQIIKFSKVEVNDEGEYTCTATNAAGTASASAVIKVRSPPEITITPQNYLEVNEGDPINIECRATNGYPEPTVSIRRQDNRQEIVPPTPGSAAIRIPSASSRDDGEYICTASNLAGNIEDQFAIRVDRGDGGFNIFPDNGGSGEEPDPYNPDYQPQIPDERPKSLIAFEGQPETIIYCNTTHNARWDRADGQPLQSNAVQYNTRLVIYNVSKSDAVEYVCNVFNEYNEVQQAAYTRLVVVTPPRMTLVPPVQTVYPGQSPTVDCVVEGDDIIDIIWRPVNRVPSSRVDTRSSTLIFHQIEVEDAGRYECFARSRYANTSATAEVYVSEDTDRPSSVSHDNEQHAHAGSAVHLSCNVTQPNVRIIWTKDGRGLPRSVRQKNDGSLFIRLAQKSDSGRYVCTIRDVYGRTMTSNYINLHIEGVECLESEFRCYDYSGCVDEILLCDGYRDCQDNSDEENCLPRDKRFSDRSLEFLPYDGPNEESQQLVLISKPQRQFRAGENVEILCRTTTRGIKARWERPGTHEYVLSFTYGDGTMLVIQSVTGADAGTYRCTATDIYGRSSYDEFILEVESGSPPGPVYPDSNVAPAEYRVRLRESVDLPCNHNLEPPVNIEWMKEFSSLPPGIRTNQPILSLDSITEADAGTYVCRVSNSRVTIEARAILVVTDVVPQFSGESYISLPTLKEPYRQFDIEISFKPTDGNGLILYNSETQGREGDYIALQLVNSIPEFTMDTGTGPLVVRGDGPLQLNAWHTIRLSRINSKVTMDVDNNAPFEEESEDSWGVLDLKQPLYIGGVPDYDQLPASLAGTSGYIGCVSMLVLGSLETNIMLDSLERNDVTECDTCAPNLCHNNGVCQAARSEQGFTCICASGFAGLYCDRTGEACRPGLCGPGKCSDTIDGYKCACPVTRTGKNCEKQQSIEYPAFTGSAFLAIKAPRPSRTLKMSMKIKANAPVSDGIIMYAAESPRGYGGFTSLAVRNGNLEFRYDLGRGSKPVVLVSNRTLPVGEWTIVNIARVGHMVSLKINMVHNFEELLDMPKLDLNLDTIYVGGVDDSITLNKNIGVTGGFNGCIKDFKVGGTPVDIMNDPIKSANIQECSSPADRGDIPERDISCQCRNGGSCSISDPTVCSCPIGFTGQYCEQRVPSTFRTYPTDPCAARPCLNGGSCRPDPSSRANFSCDCPLGFAGANCQIPLELLQSVGFNGNGYLELPSSLLSYEHRNGESTLIALAIHTTTDGVLLYQRDASASPYYGDYVLLRIERGTVILDWDTGSGKSTLSVPVLVNDGERHQIIAKLLEDGSVTLSVDNQQNFGVSNGLTNILNVDSNIYIGGIPEYLNQHALPGFTGCIEQVEFMSINRGINLGVSAVAGRNTQRCKERVRF